MGSSAGQGRAGCPLSPMTDAFLARSVTCPGNPHMSTRPARWLPRPCPGVCASYTCDGFGNLTRLCPIVSVHLVVGRNKNHLDFFPDWMIRIYFLSLVLWLFFPTPPHPVPFSSFLFLSFSPSRVGLAGRVYAFELPFPPFPPPTLFLFRRFSSAPLH